MILLPSSFGSLNLTGTAGIMAQEMDISSAVAQSKIRRVAGGGLIDFNYGIRADLIQQPFTMRVFVKGTTIADTNTAYNKLADWSTGIVGKRELFSAQDMASNTWTCTAMCESVTKILTENDNITKNTIMDGIEVAFIPLTNWVKT